MSDVQEVAEYMRHTFQQSTAHLLQPDVRLHTAWKPYQQEDSTEGSPHASESPVRLQDDVAHANLDVESFAAASSGEQACDHDRQAGNGCGTGGATRVRDKAAGDHNGTGSLVCDCAGSMAVDRERNETLSFQGSQAAPWSTAGWLQDNPLPVPTERELHSSERGRESWRMVLMRKQRPCATISSAQLMLQPDTKVTVPLRANSETLLLWD